MRIKEGVQVGKLQDEGVHGIRVTLGAGAPGAQLKARSSQRPESDH